MNEQPTTTIGSNEARRTVPAASATWGNFQLLARVGVGGFGEVYRAWDPSLQREVALKLLLPGAVAGDAEYQSVLREARALASVRHPNIVSVYGIDRHEGRVGFWTDFVQGKTLSVLVGEQGRFGAREAALIGLDVARALSAVHRAGLLHRDIKAENVMREEGGRILLMDFGLSTLSPRQAHTAGTPNYMAPELFEGAVSSVASDIYAFGVLLYFLVSGEFPVRIASLSPGDVRDAMRSRKPLIDLRPDLPDALLHTIGTAMEVDPAKRFSSAGQLANALAESLGTHAPAEVSGAALRKGRRGVVVAAGLAAVVVLGIVLLGWPGYLRKGTHLQETTDSGLTGTSYEQYQRAQDLLLHSYKQANLAKAVEEFQSLLKQDQTSGLVEARLGLAYFIQYRNSRDPKLLDLAQQATDRAIKLQPDLAAPHITLARIAAMHGQTQLAAQEADYALKLDPNNAEAYGALGEVYKTQGRDEDSNKAYQKACDLAPDDWRWPVRLGQNSWASGDLAGASTQLKRSVDLAPDNAVAYYDLGIISMESGQIEQARKYLETSLRIEPVAVTYAALGSVDLLEGKFDEAIKDDTQSIHLDQDEYEVWGDLAAAYRWSGKRPDLATSALEHEIKLAEAEHEKSREDSQLLVALADAYAAVGNKAKSLPLARQALALAPGNASIEFRAGETFEQLGMRAEAIPLIAKAVASGYRVYEFQRNPELGSLRADPAFKAMLEQEQKEKSGPH